MKKILQIEKDRKLYHKFPNKFSVHRASLLVPEIYPTSACISLLNHFVLKRGNNNVSIKISAYNNKGIVVDTYFELLLKPKVYNYNLSEIFNKSLNIKSYQIEFFSCNNLFIPYPAVIVEHISKSSHNVVHSYNRVLNDSDENRKINSLHVREGAIATLNNKKLTSGFVFHSGQNFIKSQIKLSFVQNGKKNINKTINIKLKPFNTKLITLDQILKKKVDKIDSVMTYIDYPKQDFFYGRLLSGIFSKSKKNFALSANHSFYDSTKVLEYFNNNNSFMLYPYFENFKNNIIFYPILSPSDLCVYIKPKNRNMIFCGNIKSPGTKILNIDISDIFKKNSIVSKSYLLLVVNEKGKIPTRVNHQYIISKNNNLLGASINNSLLNKNIYTNFVNKKGFSWGPILFSGDYNSYLSILNYSYKCEKNEFLLKIFSEKGKIYQKKFSTFDQDCFQFSTLNEFKNYNLANSDQMCWYTIESLKNNIHGFSFHENKKNGNISGEHSF